MKEDAPARTVRTRAKKTEPNGDEDADDLVSEPVKKATRGRPAGTAASTSAPTSKPVKKTVTFAEPDKENVVPVTGARKTAVSKPVEVPAPGIRAKPIRKPAGTGRTTRTIATKKPSKNAQDKQPPMPLSPKKATQLPVSKDRDPDSEDELAMDRTPARPFHRSPVKPAVGTKRPTKTQVEDSDAEEESLALPPSEPTALLGSPVRRPPQSPFKNSMMSPAKRIDGLQLGRPAVQDGVQSTASPLKASLLQSPAKRPPVAMKSVDLAPNPHEQAISSPFRQSLFQSPAKRLFSPVKPARAPEEVAEARSPAPTPVLLCPPPATDEADAIGAEALDIAVEANDVEQGDATGPLESDFNGRMSTLLPREVDTASNEVPTRADESSQDEDCETVVLEDQDHSQAEALEADESIVVGEPESQAEDAEPGDVSTTPPDSPPKEALDMFELRQNDLLPFDTTYSESEDEPTRVMTPNTASPVKQMRGSTMRPRTSGFGFTPLARRFDEWQARSPQKTPTARQSVGAKQDTPGSRESMGTAFFEDEMSVRPDGTAGDSVSDAEPFSAGIPEIKDPVLEDISITDEDLELAAEANEMSVMSPEQVETMLNLDGNDDSISDASQEYGDENEFPGQTAQNGVSVPPVTPKRFIRREFHTVSKVPLKAADESTPPPQPSLRTRRHSISRLPVTRPTHNLSRSATVISYSPSPSKQIDTAFEEAMEEESLCERSESVPPPETPCKSGVWSHAGTPTRTPRPEDSTLLRGATVFVDVYTMEGADASAIFVELLTQMGAHCVTTWDWNPSDEDASSKIGITHVVYKDGGKQTMEKVRETGGVVQCVGVGWVLE